MASKGKQLSELLDANGDVLQVNLDNIVVNATSVSDTDNTSTGQFTLPAGTTAQRPVTSYTGAQRLNTDLGVMEYYDGSGWYKVSAELAVLSSVTGTIFSGVETTLTLSGSGFLSSNLVVNFTQVSDAIDVDVTVTPTSATSASVTVPSSVYSNVTAGNAVSIQVTNSDGSSSSVVSKTATALPSGGTITTSGNYRIHTFTSSGQFTNTIAGLSVEYLVIAGGGGGGAHRGGGAGAGGYRTNVSGQTSGGGASAESSMTLSDVRDYTATVGAGGSASGTAQTDDGGQGSNSVFNGITSLGGGLGRSDDEAGASGGSGSGSGGGAWGGTGGSGTAGQGYAGGSNSGANNYGNSGSGGGGAGGAGLSSSGQWGAGGAGVSSNITGSSVTRASGGGGGSGNASSEPATAGGGGKGANTNDSATANYGTVNTGGGGGGGAQTAGANAAGGQGGSGIVIVRYDTTAL